jgi:hypothetical protein
MYLTGYSNANTNMATMTMIFELVEGLALIGCLEITIVNNKLAEEMLMGAYNDLAGKLKNLIITPCRPYIKVRMVSQSYAENNAEALDIDDIIIIHSGTMCNDDIEFCNKLEDVYIVNIASNDVLRVKIPMTHLIDEAANRHPIVGDFVLSAQAILAINMLAKPRIYRKTGVSVNAFEFLEVITTSTLNELGIKAKKSVTHSSPSIPTSSDSVGGLSELLAEYNVRNLTELARLKDINPATLRTRLKLGWNIRKALGLGE